MAVRSAHAPLCRQLADVAKRETQQYSRRRDIPAGISQIDAPTNAVWLLGRTLVSGETDLENVHALQDQFTLTPLGDANTAKRISNAGESKDEAQGSPVLLPYEPSKPLTFFEVLNAGLRENPPPAREAALMSLFGRIGVGSDLTFHADRLDHATAEGLRRAVAVGQQLVAADLDGAATINGWRFPSPRTGNFGDDYLLRPEEAVYPTAMEDDQGRRLNGEHKYVLRMERGQTPPVDAFWSLTMYRLPQRLLAANAIDRYSIGDRTAGLKHGHDGSLVIYIQRDPPEIEIESNWLPAPAGDFCLTLRGYLPRPELLDGTWKPPPVKHVP